MGMIVAVAVLVNWLIAKLFSNLKSSILGFVLGLITAIVVAGIGWPLLTMFVEELAGSFSGERMSRALGTSLVISLISFPFFFWRAMRAKTKQ